MQRLQDELGRLWEAIQRHHEPDDAFEGLKTRLKEISDDSAKPDISYEDWVMLDRISRRIAGKLQHTESLIDEGSLEQAKRAARKKDIVSEPTRRPVLKQRPEDSTTVELVEAAFKETRELVRIEVALARLELEKQLKQAVRAAIAFAAALVLAIVTLALFAVAIVLALGGSAGNAIAVAVFVLSLAAIAGYVGYSLLPKNPLERTRHHLEDDFKQLKEHVA